MPPCPRTPSWVFAGSHSIPCTQDFCTSARWVFPLHPDSGFSQISLPAVEGGVSVEVKVKGVVDGVPGHSQAFRVIVPLSPQIAVKHAPSPSVVL